jgi:hypothetical protein
VTVICLCLILPVRIAFEDSFNANIYIIIMDIFYDFLFIIDIILNFGIPITNREGKFIFIKIYIGEDVYDRKIVVKNYIKKYVAMDIISSIPITYL